MDFHQLVWKQVPIGEGWDDEPDPVIWTSVNVLDKAWRNAEDYVGPGGVGSNQVGKYERVGAFLLQYAGNLRLFMPSVSFFRDQVEFTDGRHRFAWLRDHGLLSMPVEVSSDSADAFRARFETTQQIGRIES